MNSQPTPETDAKASPHIGFYSCATVPAEFARQLERERDEAREELEILRSNKMSDPLLATTFKHLKAERDEAREALKCLDEAIRLMNPRYIEHPTMDGRYPCWVVWLPKGGKVERKSLRDAFLEFFAQIKEAAK